jgi:PKD repeat protein
VGNDSEGKTDYILVDPYDLTVTGVNSQQSTVFVGENNTVTITVKNNGTYTATDVLVNLYASDVNNGTTPVATTTIDSLASGASTTITMVDPTIRNINSSTTYGSSNVKYVNYTATTDPENTIPETDETNNSMASAALPVYYNGYKGKRYEYNGSDATSSETNTNGDINTQHVYDIKGDVIYSSGNSSYKGTNWTNNTTTWTSTDLNMPSTGSVVDAWLYVSYNWDSTPDGDPNWTITFNGVEISPVSWYTDQKNFGSYGTYKYGLYVYNVVNLFKTTGNNTLVINALTGNSNALYPSNLVVVYSDPAKTRKQIFINEQCDELLPSTNYGVTNEEATAYAPFTDLTINTNKVINATLHSFAASAGANEGNLLWNTITLASNAWQGDSYTASPLIYDVTSYLSTDNTAGIQGTSSGGMLALQQILVVEYDTIAPTVTANPAGGYYNTAQNVTLTAADNKDTNPTIYYTLNGQTPTTTSTLYTGPITINTTTTLKFIAVDDAGNVSPVRTGTYIMDTQAPTATANPVGGLFNDTQNVTLSGSDNLDTGVDIYYTLNGDTPTTSSTLYTGPISIGATATLKFIAVDDAGNISDVQTEVYTIDKEAPNATANPVGGLFNDTQNVTLSGSDNLDTGVDIYYTLNGDTPTTSSTLYTGPISIGATATLKFIAVDDAGNISDVQTEVYTIDTTKPIVTVDLTSGSYNTNKTVTLSATDNLDTNPMIYYTTDGSTPTSSSTLYAGPVSIDKNTTLKLIAVDDAGNVSGVQTEVYIIDKESPGVSASVDSGVFGKTQNVTLTATDNEDTNLNIYYTIDGTTPTVNSTLYTGTITIMANTVLKFFAVDDAGNISPVETKNYIIDTTVPTVTANPATGLYNTNKSVILSAEDNIDPHPKIYYTLNGDAPTTTSTLYTGAFSVDHSSILRFIAVDIFGNTSPVQSETYTIDTEAPTVAANLTSGTYNNTQTVTLNASDNLDSSPEIHYTTNGDTPTSNSTLYTGPISIKSTTTLKFIAIDDAGNVSGVRTEIYTIEQAPVARFTGTPISGTLQVAFTDTSTGNITSYAWDFQNDGTVDSNLQNPTYTYTTPGVYTVCLTVRGPGGGNSMVYMDCVNVNYPAPVAEFTANPNNGTAPLNVTFTDASTGNITSYAWDFQNDGTVDSTEQNPTYTYNTPGTYTVLLTVEGPGGSVSKTVNITVANLDITAPVPKIDIKGGLSRTTRAVTLTATDDQDTNPKIYYTTDGATPTSSSALYTGPISISKTTMLKFIAVDSAGNTSPVQTETYTIDTTAPAITSVDPANGATKVAAGKTIKVTFSEDIKKGHMWIELLNSELTAIPFTTTINGKVLTVDPTSNLAESLYTLWIHTGSVTDLAGNPVAVKSTKFSVGTSPTVSSVDPTNNKVINVANKALVITFSENIKAGSAFTSIKVTNPDGVKVNPLYKAINGKTLTLTRNGYYINGLTYTITLPTGSITDTAGNTLKTAFTSKFKIDTTQPKITSVNPRNNSSGFSLTAPITITFNENILEGINWSKITMKNLNTGKAVSFTKTKNGKTLTIKMTYTRLHKNTYQIYIPAETVKDNAGNKQNTPYTLTFKTR